MTQAYPANANAEERAATGIVKCLCLVATPTFATMALLTSVLGKAPMDTLCSAAHGSTLGGMTLMYVLMSVFHASPWLKLASHPHT